MSKKDDQIKDLTERLREMEQLHDLAAGRANRANDRAEAAEIALAALLSGCTHENVKTFRSHPPRAECLDCGASLALVWAVLP